MKNRFNRILCPIDFSDAAINAVEYAAKLAKDNHASLTLWNMNDLHSLENLQLSPKSTNLSDQFEINYQILTDWSEQIKTEFGIHCGFSLERNSNNLQKTLDFYLNGENYDLMISGTNGADSVFQFQFGTNSYNITNYSKIPVLIIPENCRFEEINSVVYMTDYKSSDAENIQSIIDTFNPSITALHISNHETAISEDVFKAHSNELDAMLKPNNKIRFWREENNNTLEGLLEFIRKNKTNLIVVSHQNRNRLTSLFRRSFTKSILETIGYPVLVLNEGILS